MRGHLFTSTVYAKVGDRNYIDGCVGIAFKPTPSVTATEIKILIDELEQLHKTMAKD